MLCEPFFSGLLLELGVDTSEWAGPVVTFASGMARHEPLRLVGAGLIGFVVSVWLHWLYPQWGGRPRCEAHNDSAAKLALAERARSASAELHEIIGEEFKPISYVSTGSEEESNNAWQAQMNPQIERAKARYQRKLAAECQEIIRSASRYLEIEESSVFFAQHVDSPHGFTHMANLLAWIAADLSAAVSSGQVESDANRSPPTRV